MSNHKDKFLSLWPHLQVGQSFWITDDIISEEFWLVDIDDVMLETRPQENIKITKQAFIEVIDYLVAHHHDEKNPCEVRTGDSYERSVPLSRIVQEANPYMKQCALNYVLAVLRALGLVEMSDARLNCVWLLALPEGKIQ